MDASAAAAAGQRLVSVTSIATEQLMTDLLLRFSASVISEQFLGWLIVGLIIFALCHGLNADAARRHQSRKSSDSSPQHKSDEELLDWNEPTPEVSQHEEKMEIISGSRVASTVKQSRLAYFSPNKHEGSKRLTFTSLLNRVPKHDSPSRRSRMRGASPPERMPKNLYRQERTEVPPSAKGDRMLEQAELYEDHLAYVASSNRDDSSSKDGSTSLAASEENKPYNLRKGKRR